MSYGLGHNGGIPAITPPPSMTLSLMKRRLRKANDSFGYTLILHIADALALLAY
jgi:hypothetical protein